MLSMNAHGQLLLPTPALPPKSRKEGETCRTPPCRNLCKSRSLTRLLRDLCFPVQSVSAGFLASARLMRSAARKAGSFEGTLPRFFFLPGLRRTPQIACLARKSRRFFRLQGF